MKQKMKRFWNESKLNNEFIPPNKNIFMTFDEFVKCVLKSRSILDEFQHGSNLSSMKKNANIDYYLLSLDANQLGNAFAHDISNWNWEKYFAICSKCEWGPLANYKLQISMKGSFTPLFCLQNENVFLQIRGYQEIILFDVNSSLSLYPFIDCHPCCNQSMVNVEFPDKQEFESFCAEFHSSNVRLNGYRAILSPGSLLYVPCGWWMESTHLNDFSMCVQIGSQAKILSVSEMSADFISMKQRLNIQQNIERLSLKEYGIKARAIFISFMNENESDEYRNERCIIMDILRNVFSTDSEIEQFLHEMIEGRYNICNETCVSRQTLFCDVLNT